MRNIDSIKKASFFSELPEADIEKILKISMERNYRKNMIIFMEYEPGEAFYYIISGKVKIFRTYEDGKEHIIHILGEGNVFGEVTLFNNIHYPASALVYEDACIGIIKNRDLEKLILENSELALRMIKILTNKLFQAQQKVKSLAFNDVFSRTASELIKLSKDYGKRHDRGILLDIELSRQELADMVSTSRETISRVVSRFKKDKSIMEDGSNIVIINIDKLKDWV